MKWNIHILKNRFLFSQLQTMNNKSSALFVVLLFCLFPFYMSAQDLTLAGKWSFAIDSLNVGETRKWFSKKLSDVIVLPGSMAENRKGNDITLSTPWTGSIYDSSFYFNPRFAKYRKPGNIHIPFWLTPAKHYVGVAWYQKEVDIPAGWKNKKITLILERPHIETKIWVDNNEVGTNNSLSAPHEYDLTNYLTGKRHRITISVDNRIKELNVGPDSHSISDHTQGNWNGIIGKICLKAEPLFSFKDIQVYPDVKHFRATVRMQIENRTSIHQTGKITLSAKSFNSKSEHIVQPVQLDFSVAAGTVVNLEALLPFDQNMLTWDEFNPNLYQLTVNALSKTGIKQTNNLQFGMREFRIEGRTFFINGKPVMLRGTLNNCEFPLTGYPAMNEQAWEKIFRTIKSYGLNHVRFHSWCPPEAAFVAADKVGLYLQPEGPSWPNHGPKIGLGQPIDQFLYDETSRILKQYGNYASFTMFAAGNEPAGKQVEYLSAFVDYWKKNDQRRVYTGMSVGGSWPIVPNAEFQVRGGVRGLPWNKRPETISTFSDGIASFQVPFVAHEMGQWCAFPDFKEIKKYTGVYKAKNFELFRSELADRGMGQQANDFLMASGKLQLLCYKHEIEKVLRTPGYAGFQLLGLQDFPGQGTALVGVLNAFWEEKGYASAADFSQFCNTTVPLASMSKFVFTNDELFEAAISLSHAGLQPINTAINWAVTTEQGTRLKEGVFNAAVFNVGNGMPVGKISFPLLEVNQASKLQLEVWINGTKFKNTWNFWVYPSSLEQMNTSNEVYYTTVLDAKAISILENGGKVFLNAAGKVIKGKEVAMSFSPVFWNTSWFKMRPPHVTGLFIQHQSPVFKHFPTAYHSDLQWWDIVHDSQVMILEDFPVDFRPLVQPIDTWFVNRRLAMIFETRVGKGKLIVSSADLSAAVSNRPAARQLYHSILQYMLSDKFHPTANVQIELVKDLFLRPSKEQVNMYTKDSPDELKPNSISNQIKQ